MSGKTSLMELWTAVSKSAIVGQNTKPKSAILSCDESEESGAGGLTLSREEGIHNWCHDVVDGNVYAVTSRKKLLLIT